MKTTNKLITAGIFLSMMFIFAAIMPGIAHAQYSGYISNYQERCIGNNLYWYDSYGNPQGVAQYCTNGCYNNACQNSYNYNNNYTYHSYEGCNGNYLYWYDSYNNPNDVVQYCTNGCYGNSCINNNYNNNNYNNCTSHAYKLCVGNTIYWYNSCNIQQDLFYKFSLRKSCNFQQSRILYHPRQVHD